jgi:hypothetical protein
MENDAQTRPEDVDLGKGSHEEQQGGKIDPNDKSLPQRGVSPAPAPDTPHE